MFSLCTILQLILSFIIPCPWYYAHAPSYHARAFLSANWVLWLPRWFLSLDGCIEYWSFVLVSQWIQTLGVYVQERSESVGQLTSPPAALLDFIYLLPPLGHSICLQRIFFFRRYFFLSVHIHPPQLEMAKDSARCRFNSPSKRDYKLV